MNTILNIIRKLFLVKEIVSKAGEVHFRRYRLLETPWFRIYIHQICRSDEDSHLHTHPWNYISWLLKGSFSQEYWEHYSEPRAHSSHERFAITSMTRHAAHRITLHSPSVWTLFFAYGKREDWGYLLNGGAFINNKVYRILKNEGKL
jgi:hypothetical protein